MKYCFLFLLLFTLASCDKEVADTKELAAEDTFIIGYTGGWGGGPAFKLEDGQLFRSEAERFLGGPDQIINIAYVPVTESEEEIIVIDLISGFSEVDFINVDPKFDCREQAYDGTCPYLIQVKGNEEVRFWTLSEFDEEINPEFAAYMGRVSSVLDGFWE